MRNYVNGISITRPGVFSQYGRQFGILIAVTYSIDSAGENGSWST